MPAARTTTGWVFRRETVIGSAILALAFVLLAGVSLDVLRHAAGGWSAAAGHGAHGTWTATRSASDGGHTDWYGDFAPAGGGPVRHDVPLQNDYLQVRVGQPIAVAVSGDNPGSAFASSQRWDWLPLAGFGLIFAVAAAVPLWLALRQLIRSNPGRARPAA